jgi:hypothetical protein
MELGQPSSFVLFKEKPIDVAGCWPPSALVTIRSQGLKSCTNPGLPPAVSCMCRLDEVAFHFSFTYYSMLGGGQGSNSLSQLAGLYTDHSVSPPSFEQLLLLLLLLLC